MAVKVSIIVPLPAFNDYIREAIPYYEKLDFKDFELIILPDEPQDEVLSKTLPIRVIVSGKVGPAEKRDLGAKNAKGSILAFIDDDAFPEPHWLTNAVARIEKGMDGKDVGAAGGPAVTPPSDPFWRRISGNVYASAFVSAQNRRRYTPVRKVIEDYDIPSVNLIMRRDIFLKVGGFDSSFYPGEDTKLCLQVKRMGYVILYDPDILVYHHRRNLFWTHFKQITGYAWHRGYFVKEFPETSLKIAYFIPSMFLVGLVLGIPLSFASPVLAWAYLGTLGVYTLMNLVFSFNKNIAEWFFTMIGTTMSHLAYGLYFIIGLFTKKIVR